MTNRAIKYRVYPTTEQSIMFAKTFGCCRKIYNLMLSDKINNYKETKSFGKHTPAMYKKDYPFLKEKVDKWFPSSQICHCCGTVHLEMKDLTIRTMKCDCGLTISRDQNAALNILNEGLRLLTEAA